MDSKKPITRRESSICPTNEEILLEAVLENKFEKIRSIVQENPDIVNHEYDYPYLGNILYVACSEESVKPLTIQILVETGSNPCEETADQGEAIHVLSRLTRSEELKVLVSFLTSNQVNRLFKGNNALHILIKEGDYDKKDEMIKCAKTLIDAGININHKDLKNLTPILWAIKKDCKELVEIMVNNSSTLDLDNSMLNGKSARELILEKYAIDLPLPNNFKQQNNDDLLFSYLKTYNEDAFISFNNGDLFQYRDIDDSNYTLLQLACHLGLNKAVDHLLQNRADPTKTTSKQSRYPLELASENGYYPIVKLILHHYPTLKVSSQILSLVLSKVNLSDSSENEYEKTFEILLQNQDDVSLNTGNEYSQTPLHFAVKLSKSKYILDLLRRGASLANENDFNIMPIEEIEAEVLEQHLDECVELNDIDRNNVSVSLNYRTLLPFPLKRERKLLEDGDRLVPKSTPEVQAVYHICKSTHLRYLLTHPVIVTFLLLKWHKIRKLFYTNLFFYITFFISLLVYVFSSYGDFKYIGDYPSLSYFANMSFCVLIVCFLILVVRELFQIVVNPKNYYKNLENYLEIFLIILVALIIFTDEPSRDTRKQLSSVAILLAAFEFVLLMGHHPSLTTNVVMLKTVSFNFLKFLAWYSFLIVAFALSFFILFSETSEDTADNKNEENDNEENLFNNPGVSLFKTFVMLTGEFDAGSINFHAFPITSKIIFILFVLMIAIILLNLLNGLAVSDTQTIKNDAEYVGLIARTEHILYVESMVMGNILPMNLLNFIKKLCCCIPYFENISLAQISSKYVCLYPRTHVTIPLNNEKETMRIVDKISKKRSSLSVFSSFYVNKNITRKIKKVLQKQKVQDSENILRMKIRRLEGEQNEVLHVLNKINDKLALIEAKMQ